MKSNNSKCQSCKKETEITIFDNDDPVQPYIICDDCKDRLVSYSLRPQEWFNLASIHGPFKPLLHDDFYDDDGKACQAEKPVQEANLFPYPMLSAISSSLPDLINFAFSKWYFDNEIITALKNHDKQSILQSITDSVNNRQNIHIESRSYEIVAYCLGDFAAKWIKGRISVFSEESYFTFFLAIAKCLPFEEGFNLATDYLSKLPSKEIAEKSSILSWFTSSKALSFIEKHASSPVQDIWGRLASVSDFSWEKADEWLRKGRPLSLISLDALHSITRYDTLLLQELRPVLKNAPDQQVIVSRLKEYEKIDSVPRVERIIDSIINQIQFLYISESSYPEEKNKRGA